MNPNFCLPACGSTPFIVQVPGPAGPAGAASLTGNGSPQNVQTAVPGILYFDVANGNLWGKFTGTGNTGWIQVNSSSTGGGLSGVGTPEGSQVANPGTTYLDTSTSNFWVKLTGTGLTGWTLLIG